MFSTLSPTRNENNDNNNRPISAIIIGGASDGTKRYKVETAPAGNLRIEGFSKPQRIKLVVAEPVKAAEVVRQVESEKHDSPPESKDQKKVMHREIERKRRDRINDWIMTLAKKVPSCRDDHTKQGQSKSGILAKASTYIDEMREELDKLQECAAELYGTKTELHELRRRCMRLESETEKQKELLDKHNIKYDPV